MQLFSTLLCWISSYCVSVTCRSLGSNRCCKCDVTTSINWRLERKRTGSVGRPDVLFRFKSLVLEFRWSSLFQGCTNYGHHVALANKFRTVAPFIGTFRILQWYRCLENVCTFGVLVSVIYVFLSWISFNVFKNICIYARPWQKQSGVMESWTVLEMGVELGKHICLAPELCQV
jgi:hypothetical protein